MQKDIISSRFLFFFSFGVMIELIERWLADFFSCFSPFLSSCDFVSAHCTVLLYMASGRFWLERFRDAWESCSHKKAVVAAVFTLVWNVSSTVARVWAVFMLVVAMKCYQQRMMECGWSSTVEEPAADEDGPPQEGSPARPGPSKAQDNEAQGFVATAVAARQRRTPVSGEFARERLRVRGGIQPR
ncbi:hypothetical protein GUJ93_ZPchr0008g13343 [Zizania palustris]|uniref:Reticulon domain-containing protein n=1 Tax=Zizania palustris TaxID=103762 RepID=A0A8J5RHH5_ZIZPA|nr:hypothetical protein GUJ93_ZPchr0008g13343 [Zizania palustris]